MRLRSSWIFPLAMAVIRRPIEMWPVLALSMHSRLNNFVDPSLCNGMLSFATLNFDLNVADAGFEAENAEQIPLVVNDRGPVIHSELSNIPPSAAEKRDQLQPSSTSCPYPQVPQPPFVAWPSAHPSVTPVLLHLNTVLQPRPVLSPPSLPNSSKQTSIRTVTKLPLINTPSRRIQDKSCLKETLCRGSFRNHDLRFERVCVFVIRSPNSKRDRDVEKSSHSRQSFNREGYRAIKGSFLYRISSHQI